MISDQDKVQMVNTTVSVELQGLHLFRASSRRL